MAVPGESTGHRLELSLDRLYRDRFTDAQRRARVRLWQTLCDSFFARYVPANAVVLDLGAGFCDFINQIPAGRRIAVDLNPDTRCFAAPGVEVHQVGFDRLTDVIGPDSIDLAFASNVFEHLRGPDALLEVLDAVRQLLRPGGRLLILQPNIRAVGTHFWDYVDHTLPLTERGMAEALRLSGFEIDECRARFLPYTVKSRLPRWPWIVRLYLKLRPAHLFFGKQMFLVARRAS